MLCRLPRQGQRHWDAGAAHPAGARVATLSLSPTSVNLVDFCGLTIRDDGLIINSHRDSRRYYFVATGTDCSLTMQAASPKDKVQFQFRFFLVYSLLRLAPSGRPPPNATGAPLPPETARPSQRGPGQTSSGGDWELQDPCNAGSYVQFYDGRGRAAEPLGVPLCGKSIPRPILSTGNYLTLRLVTRGQQPRVDFVGDFTSFRLGFSISECSEEPYFQCRNSKCIPRSLVCDRMGIDNCGDGSDQAAHPPAKCRGHLPTSASLQLVSSPAASVTPCMAACAGAEKSQPLAPDTAPLDKPAAGERSSGSLLPLYILLGLGVGSALLLWCCWSPGWFVWRLGACRFLPGCNSVWASCQLCPRSCAHRNHGCSGKVTPQPSDDLPL
ncbi:low-density lipoprotein receptor class A domain-containing protein 2 isoform X1 [Chelonia mydas]|uniref:low-density lipoprotein receptor class A domain-containing protein 2 isoform X1 n=2 Tax=Chelonia mydas TaxID=8469 RepID=UPI0018A20119|nr:low-density lipoprotein receptor class A domain-containing protein 2 isoform X1 [Chelonia mydas]